MNKVLQFQFGFKVDWYRFKFERGIHPGRVRDYCLALATHRAPVVFEIPTLAGGVWLVARHSGKQVVALVPPVTRSLFDLACQWLAWGRLKRRTLVLITTFHPAHR
jgi:hypothetical protein